MLVLSVIIVNWNVCELLEECLYSVYSGTEFSAGQFEVIVVDNHSSDSSVEMVRRAFPQVRLIVNHKNIGFGRANNQALPFCRGRFILLLNPDTVVPQGALDKLLAHARSRPDVGAFGCRLLNKDGSLQRWTGGSFPRLSSVASHYLFIDNLRSRFNKRASLYLSYDADVDLDVDWVSGACLLLRRECLTDIIFNEDFFMYGEDIELCWRLHKAGWRVVYTPIVSIIHYQGASMKKQTDEILLSSIKGLRSFYIMTRSRSMLWAVDILTLTGFFLRWMIYGAINLLRPRHGYDQKASSSQQYVRLTLKAMKDSA